MLDFQKNWLITLPFLFRMQMNLINIVVSDSVMFACVSFYNVSFLCVHLFSVVRRLLNYESPFLAVKLSGESASLVMRKRYGSRLRAHFVSFNQSS